MKVSLVQRLLVKDALVSKEELCLLLYTFSYKVCSVLCLPNTSCAISVCLYLPPITTYDKSRIEGVLGRAFFFFFSFFLFPSHSYNEPTKMIFPKECTV